MLHCIARTTTVSVLCLMFGLCRGQQNVPDSAIYAAFFRQVAQLKSGATVLLNGENSGLVQPSVQESMGLTDRETEILQALATNCDSKTRTLDEAVRPAIFEARLQLIDSADKPARVRLIQQRLNDFENRRNQIVRVCIDELRHAFSGPRFEVVQAYIWSRKNADFFPPISK
jgi:hypothetical protein